MANSVRHTYYSIFKLEKGVLKQGEDFINDRDAHEHADKKDYAEYIVLPVYVREKVEGSIIQNTDSKEARSTGPINRKRATETADEKPKA